MRAIRDAAADGARMVLDEYSINSIKLRLAQLPDRVKREQVKQLTGLSLSTIDRLSESNKLTKVKDGKRAVSITKQSLIKFINSQNPQNA